MNSKNGDVSSPLVDDHRTKVNATETAAAEPAEAAKWRNVFVPLRDVLLFRRAFQDRSIEELYQRYCQHHKESDVDCFFVAACLIAIHSAVNATCCPDDGDVPLRSILLALVSAGVAVTQVVLGLCIRRWRQHRTERASTVVLTATYTAWLLVNIIILALLHFEPTVSQWSLTWLLLVNFLTCVTLPIRLLTCLIFTTTTGLLFVVLSAWNVSTNPTFQQFTQQPIIQQVTGNLLLLLGSISLGLLAYLVSDSRQRRAFLDTRQSFEMRLTIEEQAREQEQLLLSVLPEHVAVKMRQDLGTAHDGQFKKIYMSRHENVSILFADIVGFTAISSTYPASELVHILNELFARFDRLSQRYHQMRIKILGDCYYCICGAPVERPDHAVLCVYMGLAMIDAIKCVRESTSSPVDMRVGIHTGAVLAGVLGQRQWQFDVYSHDTELANKMESSGQPGRVHVSSRTLGFLGDQFHVEAAHGERKEEVLRMAGIETYFILSAKNPMNEPAEEEVKPSSGCGAVSSPPAVAKVETVVTLTNPQSEDSASAGRFDCLAGCCCYRDFKQVETSVETDRLISTNFIDQQHSGSDSGSGTRLMTQTFLDASKEAKYRQYHDPIAVYNLLALPIGLTSVTAFVLATTQWSHMYILLLAAIFLLILQVVWTLADTCHSCSWAERMTGCGDRINVRRLGFRSCLVTVAISLLAASHLAANIFNSTLPCPAEAVLVMISVTLVPHLASCLKGAFLLLLAGVYSWRSWLWTEIDARCWFYRQEDFSWSAVILSSCVLIAASIALYALARHLEATSRLLFLWQHQVEEQSERAADLRRRNQALLCNILPPHVAAHFLTAQRQIQQQQQQGGEQLYSQSYTNVGVLFASIPNFAEFYSEETVNNQGLECLRFLNEVISDFDALLDKSQFLEITKIKTIGSTYMAASGLNVTQQTTDEEDVLNYWRHLSLLVEFALAMQRTLQSINDQSFNHFVLRMGINHGPITAGVIGASKPHYDIWGNAVNVASRMESTGKAGCIQVTEETSGILRHFGYTFEQRGLVSVKGKGQLLTYYLIENEGVAD